MKHYFSCLSDIASEPLKMHWKTQFDSEYPSVLTDHEVVPQMSTMNSDIALQFASRCTEGYYLSLCYFPQGCDSGEYTTYTLYSDDESNERGYYEQLVKHLLPCNVFKYEISAMPNNFTLYEHYLFTKAETTNFAIIFEDIEVQSYNGKIKLSWILTQPCIDEYHIKICDSNVACWNGIFDRPIIETDEDFYVSIDLTSIEDFDYELHSCHEYNLVLTPKLNGSLIYPDFQIPFIYKEKILPPSSMTITNITHNSMVVSWKQNDCMSSGEVLIVVSQDEKIIHEYKPKPYELEYLMTDLESCTYYLIEVFTLESSIRSEESQMMVAITQPDQNVQLKATPHSNSIHVLVESITPKCVKVQMRDKNTFTETNFNYFFSGIHCDILQIIQRMQRRN